MSNVRYIDAIQRALGDALASDPRVFIYGQDIAGSFGGAFKATKGLSERFPGRVLNSPISEDGQTGVAIGAAADGMRPVIEYQFADFASNAFTQIVNQAATWYWRTGTPCPITLRLPAGGTPGGGPFHCQMPDGWLTGHPGLIVVAPATVADAYFMLRDAIACDDPVLYIEHKHLYSHLKSDFDPATDEHLPLGKAAIRRPGDDLTIVSYSGMVQECLRAAATLQREHGIDAEVLDLRCLRPLDTATILASVARTGRLLTVTEGWPFGGVAAEVTALVVERGFAWLDAAPCRLAAQDTPVPYNVDLFHAHHPDAARIVTAARATVEF